MRFTLAITLLVTGLLGAMAAFGDVPEDVRAQIEARTRQFTQAHIDGDVALINGCFTSDARVLAPGAHAVIGLEAISSLNKEWVEYGVYEFTETSTHTYGTGSYVIDEGVYFLRYGPERVEEHGKYINIWTQEDGEWKIFSNIWNTSPTE